MLNLKLGITFQSPCIITPKNKLMVCYNVHHGSLAKIIKYKKPKSKLNFYKIYQINLTCTTLIAGELT